MKTKIYVSGAISGLPIETAKANFQKAENHLKSLGYEVINPMNLPHLHGQTWNEFMREDLIAILDCQSIYMLVNFQESKGAKVEWNLAVQLDFEIVYENA